MIHKTRTIGYPAISSCGNLLSRTDIVAQTRLLIDTLKYALKDRSMTYADVAAALALSEASIKRLFAERNLSLDRLDAICALLNMEISDLCELALERQQQLIELTEEQEKELVAEPKLLFVAYMLLNEVNFEQIKENYAIDEHEGIQLLAKLDRIRFLDLLPGNRVKLHTSRNFRWRKGGPIESMFNSQIRKEFFQSNFSADNESMQFASAMVSESTLLQMQLRIAKLIQEFNQLASQDAKLPLAEKTGASFVGAVRPWDFSLFSALRRE